MFPFLLTRQSECLAPAPLEKLRNASIPLFRWGTIAAPKVGAAPPATVEVVEDVVGVGVVFVVVVEVIAGVEVGEGDDGGGVEFEGFDDVWTTDAADDDSPQLHHCC
jgi:hypothetical protein